jgi:mannose-6-phosphate isomerase-like protein (cupin superfamily)
MRLATDEREIRAGDAVVIAPGIRHKVWATGDEPLRFLCCCSPAYTHDDTVLTE